MRTTAGILHLDLDAFFAGVEQRDKPSLRGKPVVVGGVGTRGVVATASYEARAFGARSAMPTIDARRRCPPGTAFLYPRGAAYRKSSQVVMGLLHELSPTVEQVSIDEAYVDLADAGIDLTPAALEVRMRRLLEDITEVTGGLTASVGVGSSKMLAKICSDLDKPRGMVIVPPGEELEVLAPLSVRVLAGVGPVTGDRLRTFGVETVADLQRMSRADLVSIFGDAHGNGLYAVSRARDDRRVETEREAKSISAEETFPVDVVDRAALDQELVSLVDRVSARLAKHASFARTVTIKVRHHDFTTFTRSETLLHPTGDPAVILRVARELLAHADIGGGLRLLGAGVAGLTTHAQEQFDLDTGTVGQQPAAPARPLDLRADADATWGRHTAAWQPGQDVRHAEHGTGWVWGSGRGLVTVRFEGPLTGPGPIRTVPIDDPQLEPADPPDWWDKPADPAQSATLIDQPDV